MNADHRTTHFVRRGLLGLPLQACQILAVLLMAGTAPCLCAQQPTKRPISERYLDPSGFPWPDSARVAVSLTFDDGRSSQLLNAVPLLDSTGVKATFYVQPDSLVEKLELWKKAVASGHEIGNHSMGHPCTGNFAWVRWEGVALEDYDLDRIRTELVQANDLIEERLGVRPVSYAYPCGQTFVGRGRDTRSYVPLVAEIFQTGRRWLDETSNAPDHFDPSQLMSMKMDGADFSTVQRMIERARRNETWLVLAGHGVSDSATSRWGTKLGMLRELLAYARDPDNGVWLAPVSEVASFIAREQAARVPAKR